MEAKTEKKKVEEEKVDASLSIFEERDSDPKVLRKVKILDRSKEFGKTEGKEKSKELSAETEKALRAAFKKWSLDKKTIGRTEVIRALRSAGTMPSEEDLDSIMEGISQGNGKIDFDDWQKAHTRKTSRKKKQDEPDAATAMEQSLRRKRGNGPANL